MSLSKKIEAEFKQAFVEKNQSVVSVLRMLKSVIKNEEINKKKELDEQEIESIIKTEIKKRKESIVEYQKGDRQDLAEIEEQELKILEKYLPEQMSEEQIKEKVIQVLAQADDADKENFGKVMGLVMKEVGSAADGNLVRQVLQQELNN